MTTNNIMLILVRILHRKVKQNLTTNIYIEHLLFCLLINLIKINVHFNSCLKDKIIFYCSIVIKLKIILEMGK